MIELFVPGRVCLFGEHSDWAGELRGRCLYDVPKGRTIVFGTEQGLYATAEMIDAPELRMAAASPSGGRQQVTLPLHGHEIVDVARAGGFWSYVAGTAHLLALEHAVAGGVRINNHCSTLPARKGLSSSAAACVLVAKAFNELWGLQLSMRGVMEYAYRGETLTPSQCGRMDQACAFGAVPVDMQYDGALLRVAPVQLAAPLHFVLVDLRADKDTTQILQALRSAYAPGADREEHKALRSLLGGTNQTICSNALAHMAAGDAESLGALMSHAQAEFDRCAAPLCHEQLSAPRLHAVLEHRLLEELIWGGKGVGSQGDGTAQLLCRSAEAAASVCSVLERDLGVICMRMTLDATTG